MEMTICRPVVVLVVQWVRVGQGWQSVWANAIAVPGLLLWARDRQWVLVLLAGQRAVQASKSMWKLQRLDPGRVRTGTAQPTGTADDHETTGMQHGQPGTHRAPRTAGEVTEVRRAGVRLRHTHQYVRRPHVSAGYTAHPPGRWVRNQSAAARATCSRVPGSSNRCVAPGTTRSSASVSISASA